jgi:GntR family transcriptional regulator
MAGRRPTLVEEVRQSLMEQLSSGVFQVGDRLPNEQEMCERFNVSRATVREAYRALIDAGYLSRKHGTGTFVTRLPNRHSIDLNLSYTAMIQEAGYTPSVTIVQRSREVADEQTRDLLQLAEGEEVVLVERVRYADDSPVVYSLDRIPARIVPDGDLESVTPSLFEFLESLDHGARNGRARILPVLAGARESRHLAVAEGVPLLHFDEVDYDDKGVPVLASQEWHTSDVFEMWINRKAQPH